MSAVSTFQATIYVAGDLVEIKAICREYCFNSSPCVCVTVTPTEFIYSGASETGAAIGLINYPRFPQEPQQIMDNAVTLANLILQQTYQRSCTVVGRDHTLFLQNPHYSHKS